MDGDGFGRIIYLGVLIVAISGYLLVEYRGRLGQMARGLMAWGLIFVGVMAGYGLWSDMRTTLRPQQSVIEGGRIEIPRAQDGHYYVTLKINGKAIGFLVDTGATNVVLTQADAQRLGIDPASLVYLGSAQTANGTVQTARVELSNVELGPVKDPKLTAYVNNGEMDGSLLGMEYLGRFHIEITADRMILTR